MKKRTQQLLAFSLLLAAPLSAYAWRASAPRIVPPPALAQSGFSLPDATDFLFRSTSRVERQRMTVSEATDDLIFTLSPYTSDEHSTGNYPEPPKPAYVELRHDVFGVGTVYQMALMNGTYVARVPIGSVRHPFPQDFALFAWSENADWTNEDEAFLRHTYEGLRLH